MSRSVDNLRKMGVTNITFDAIQACTIILNHLWSKFEAQHELIRTALKDKYLESEYVKADFIDFAVSNYVTQRNPLTGYDKFKTESFTAPKSEPNQEHAFQTSLPHIKL